MHGRFYGLLLWACCCSFHFLQGIKKTFVSEPNKPKANPSAYLPPRSSGQNIYLVSEDFDASRFNDESLPLSIFPPL
jgi:hypothetical protein